MIYLLAESMWVGGFPPLPSPSVPVCSLGRHSRQEVPLDWSLETGIHPLKNFYLV